MITSDIYLSDFGLDSLVDNLVDNLNKPTDTLIMKKKNKLTINDTHPMLGYRVLKAEKSKYMADIKAITELLNKRQIERFRRLTRTDIFRMALRIGLEELKKKKNL